MRRLLLAITALAVIVPASAFAASLSKVGGVFQIQPIPYDAHERCTLADGTTLTVKHGDDGAVTLEHSDATGKTLALPVLVATGLTYSPSISCSPGGGAIVAWAVVDIHSRQYRVVSGDHATLSEVRTVASADGNWVDAAFAISQDGYAVAWQERSPQNVTRIWTQAFEAGGTARFAPILLSDTANVWKGVPAVALDSESNAIVGWNATDWQVSRIVAIAVDPSGATSGTPLSVFEGTDSVTGSGTWVDAAGTGRFQIAWSGWSAGGPLGQRLHIDGAAGTTTTTTSSTTTTLEDDPTPLFGVENDLVGVTEKWWIDLDLVGDGAQSWLALWHRGVIAVSSDGGRRWTKPQPRGDDYPPRVYGAASDGSGEWMRMEEGYVRVDEDSWADTIALSRSSEGGRVWSEPYHVCLVPRIFDESCPYNDDYVSAATMARASNGTVLFTWHQYSDYHCENGGYMTFRVFQIRSLDDGNTWSEPQMVDGDFESLSFYPTLRLEPAGDGVWLLNVRSQGARILRSADDGVSWSVVENPGFQWYSDIACEADGTCVAVYTGIQIPMADTDVFVSSSRDGGLSWTVPTLLDPGARSDAAAEGSASIATDGKGLWTAVWSSHRNLGGETGFDADVLEASSTDAGASWTLPRTLNSGAPQDGWVNDLDVQIEFGERSWVAIWSATPAIDHEIVPRVAVANPDYGNGVVDEGEECDDGNSVDGDGCDSNGYFTACGNGRITIGEECDDGNLFDADSCASDCAVARCGDGIVRLDDRSEECDDGNASDSDDCTSSCRFPICGDGITSAGEECDDRNRIYTDACLPDCRLATCGDGYLRSGVEQCDDGNTFTTDRCPVDCRAATCGDGHLWLGVEYCEPSNPDPVVGCPGHCGVTLCGDTNADGLRTPTDSLTILSHAVGKPNRCPREQCDVDASFAIDTRDALITLGVAVGRPYVTSCDLGPWLTIRLDDDRVFGAVQAAIDFSDAPIWMPVKSGSTPHCESLIPQAMAAAGRDASTLNLGVISTEGFRGPADLARCRVDLYGELQPGQLRIRVDEATDPNSDSVHPFPAIAVRAGN